MSEEPHAAGRSLPPTGVEVRIVDDGKAVARAAAAELRRCLSEAIAARGRATVALSGGSTPHLLFERLAATAGQIEWARVEFVWGDERSVPADDPASNFGAAWRLLLSKMPVPEANVHRIQGELPPETAARAYEELLRQRFEPSTLGPPRFDLVLLGLGADGHTASLFPGTEAVDEQRRWVVAAGAPSPPYDRISLTLPVLNAAAQVLFLVSGAAKATAVEQVLGVSHRPGPGAPPAARVRLANGRVLWILDRPAAARWRQGAAGRPRS